MTESVIEIVLIAAIAADGVIGRGGTMPWRLKSDMRHFRALTLGKPVVMGRKTYLSLSIRPLPGRTNIVVSRDPDFTAPGVLVAASLAVALQAGRADALRRGAGAVMVIGGAEIYAQAMRLADRLEITRIHARIEGDARFPAIDPAAWGETARAAHPAAEGDDAAYDFVTFHRREAGRTPR
jgi:dihydrofolate reductase